MADQTILPQCAIYSIMTSIRYYEITFGQKPEKIFVNYAMMNLLKYYYEYSNFTTFMNCSLQEYSDNSDTPEYYIAGKRGEYYRKKN